MYWNISEIFFIQDISEYKYNSAIKQDILNKNTLKKHNFFIYKLLI